MRKIISGVILCVFILVCFYASQKEDKFDRYNRRLQTAWEFFLNMDSYQEWMDNNTKHPLKHIEMEMIEEGYSTNEIHYLSYANARKAFQELDLKKEWTCSKNCYKFFSFWRVFEPASGAKIKEDDHTKFWIRSFYEIHRYWIGWIILPFALFLVLKDFDSCGCKSRAG